MDSPELSLCGINGHSCRRPGLICAGAFVPKADIAHTPSISISLSLSGTLHREGAPWRPLPRKWGHITRFFSALPPGASDEPLPPKRQCRPGGRGTGRVQEEPPAKREKDWCCCCGRRGFTHSLPAPSPRSPTRPHAAPPPPGCLSESLACLAPCCSAGQAWSSRSAGSGRRPPRRALPVAAATAPVSDLPEPKAQRPHGKPRLGPAAPLGRFRGRSATGRLFRGTPPVPCWSRSRNPTEHLPCRRRGPRERRGGRAASAGRDVAVPPLWAGKPPARAIRLAKLLLFQKGGATSHPSVRCALRPTVWDGGISSPHSSRLRQAFALRASSAAPPSPPNGPQVPPAPAPRSPSPQFLWAQPSLSAPGPYLEGGLLPTISLGTAAQRPASLSSRLSSWEEDSAQPGFKASGPVLAS